MLHHMEKGLSFDPFFPRRKFSFILPSIFGHWKMQPLPRYMKVLVIQFLSGCVHHLTFPKWSPDWCASVGWMLSHKAKGCRLDSRSAHVPGLQIQSPIRARTRGSQSMFLSHIIVSLPCPLSRNK